MASTMLSVSAVMIAGAALAQPIATTPGAATTTLPVSPDQAQGAATAGGPGSAASTVQEVVVTGSRIAGLTNLNSSSPVAVATHQDIVLSKANSVEQVLDRLPQVDFNGGLSGSSNNGGGGLSEISLRNLGPARTLVLLDGQRIIPNGGAVDYNIIPLELVDHVEVLKDGASSIYGADAIGGVATSSPSRTSKGFASTRIMARVAMATEPSTGSRPPWAQRRIAAV
ncbi:MAG: TonB-dependent receptor plug domain-containing protein [Caulobacteraceae bacterium]